MTDIVEYELVQVPPRWLFLRLETRDGLVGWGEPIVEGRAATVETAVEEIMDAYLLGEDPAPIEDHWQEMYRGGFYRGGPVLMSAIAGIDQALWDIKGKRFDAPIYELLGGPARDRVRVYRGAGGSTPEEAAESARGRVDAGYTAIKTGVGGDGLRRIDNPATVDRISDVIGAMREAAGDEIDIGIDFHGRVTKSMAKRLFVELEEHDPMFYEEPVLAEHNDALPSIAAHTSVPLATGERMFSRWDFKEVFENQRIDVVQPDLSHAGGITEVHKIAAMAEAYDVAIAPHCPLGPIAFAACVQIDAACPNALVQEQSLDVHDPEGSEGLSYLEDPDAFSFADGYVEQPDEPGLGIEVDREVVNERADDHGWHNPVLRNPDGSVTEW